MAFLAYQPDLGTHVLQQWPEPGALVEEGGRLYLWPVENATPGLLVVNTSDEVVTLRTEPGAQGGLIMEPGGFTFFSASNCNILSGGIAETESGKIDGGWNGPCDQNLVWQLG